MNRAFEIKCYGLLDGIVDCCVPGTVHGSGAPKDSEAGAALLYHAELCWSQAGTIVIILITVQLRFRLAVNRRYRITST